MDLMINSSLPKRIGRNSWAVRLRWFRRSYYWAGWIYQVIIWSAIALGAFFMLESKVISSLSPKPSSMTTKHGIRGILPLNAN